MYRSNVEAIVKWFGNASLPEKRAAAIKAGTSVAYLRHLAKGYRKASPTLEVNIIRAIGTLSTQHATCPVCGGAIATHEAPAMNRQREALPHPEQLKRIARKAKTSVGMVRKVVAGDANVPEPVRAAVKQQMEQA